MNKFNDQEKRLMELINESKSKVEGELEIDHIDNAWYEMDYKENLGGAFHLYHEYDGSPKPLITDDEIKENNIDIIKCLSKCGVYCVA